MKIFTITCNPSLDYLVGMTEFRTGEVNRTETEMILPGGKGLNVSMVLKNLGVDSTALGFLAGFTGDEIRRRMEEIGCQTDFIQIQNGWSRINVKMKAKEESEINGQGPEMTKEDIENLFGKLDKMQKGDILVLAGSIPRTLPDTIYSDIMKYLEQKEIRVVVDATKDLLMNVLSLKPFLVKPNNHELGEMFGVVIKEKASVIEYGKKLKEMGAVNVLVSMAGDGAVLIDQDGLVYESQAPKGKVVNSVGAGDSMVAGFLAGYLKYGNYRDAFYMGVAAGSASAFSKNLATGQEVAAILKSMGISEEN